VEDEQRQNGQWGMMQSNTLCKCMKTW
jgi:hypothetical protein